jgi:hypothetical protein
MEETRPLSITSLITIPALITLGITILRLVGELQHWPKPWFNPAAGGGGAVIGISWLPILFGPYFALKLAGAGDGPSSAGKAIGLAFAGLAVLVVGVLLMGVVMAMHHPNLAVIGYLVTLLSAFTPGIGWRSLGKCLLAYAFAARIPVVVVMYLAMSGNGGQGWGTHYDAAPPNLQFPSFGTRFLYTGVFPQLGFWIGWTVVAGAIVGTIANAIARRGKQAVPAAV